MKTVLLIFSLALTGASAENSDNELFVILTSADEETQMMAMVLATQAAEQGTDLRILLCSDAGKLAIRGLDSKKLEPSEKSPGDLLSALMNRGVKVEVCRLFIPNHFYIRSDLVDGVSQADPAEVANFMMRPNVRLLTF